MTEIKWFFGEYLQRLLQAKKWTAATLAKKSKLSHVYIGNLLDTDRSKGNRPPRVSVDTITALADALDTPECKLLLAYQGIDPDQYSAQPYRENFNILSEISAVAERQGINLEEMQTDSRYAFEGFIFQTLRKMIHTLVLEELQKIKEKHK
jgi:transcriptional regulator with XRE-family HTH domain